MTRQSTALDEIGSNPKVLGHIRVYLTFWSPSPESMSACGVWCFLYFCALVVCLTRSRSLPSGVVGARQPRSSEISLLVSGDRTGFFRSWDKNSDAACEYCSATTARRVQYRLKRKAGYPRDARTEWVMAAPDVDDAAPC